MKIALFLILSLSAKVASAKPEAREASFDCFSKPQTDDGWQGTNAATVTSDSQGLRVDFGPTALNFLQTTDSPTEYLVEARCEGYVVVRDNKPFKIRDFSFVEIDADIASNDGKIELISKGFVSNVAGETDEFDKNWSIKKSPLDSYNNENDPTKKAKISPFAAKAESKTLCATELTLRFQDLHSKAQRKQNQPNLETEIDLSHLLVTFDPC